MLRRKLGGLLHSPPHNRRDVVKHWPFRTGFNQFLQLCSPCVLESSPVSHGQEHPYGGPFSHLLVLCLHAGSHPAHLGDFLSFGLGGLLTQMNESGPVECRALDSHAGSTCGREEGWVVGLCPPALKDFMRHADTQDGLGRGTPPLTLPLPLSTEVYRRSVSSRKSHWQRMPVDQERVDGFSDLTSASTSLISVCDIRNSCRSNIKFYSSYYYYRRLSFCWCVST